MANAVTRIRRVVLKEEKDRDKFNHNNGAKDYSDLWMLDAKSYKTHRVQRADSPQAVHAPKLDGKSNDINASKYEIHN